MDEILRSLNLTKGVCRRHIFPRLETHLGRVRSGKGMNESKFTVLKVAVVKSLFGLYLEVKSSWVTRRLL